MQNNYTKPALRERIKNRIMAGSKGGNPGQWSARKSQILIKAYKDGGGGYKGPKTNAQKSLTKWTGEKWGNSSKAVEKKVKATGIIARYLPAKAWSLLTASQKLATNRKKIKASKIGKQFVVNTAKAKIAGKKVRS